jgi:putative PIN family toxin of toxin-antitoxin system
MRVVFDTVILVRSLLDPYSWSGRLLFERNDAYEWVVSPEVVAEYLQVIRRPRLVNKYRTVGNRDLKTILAQIATATMVHPKHTPAICRDPEDDKFLAVAKTGNVSFIVSEDKDLLALVAYEGIQICTANVLLNHLGFQEN